MNKITTIKKTRNINRIARTILIALVFCLVPAFALAAETDQTGDLPERPIPNGHKHVDIDIFHGPGGLEAQESSTRLPAKYDSRTQSWYRNFQVNDQGNTNLCWACAASEAAQISYAKETAGAKKTRLSPTQLGYYFYNRENDPLGNTGGDGNNGWDYDWIEAGGNVINTFEHMTTWSGLVSYDDAPLTLDYDDDYTGYGSRWGGAFPSRLAYDSNVCTLQNTVFYDSLDYTSESDRNIVKSLVQKYGAVVISMEFDELYFEYGDTKGINYYHCDPYYRNNHEVVIVGWDDNYSADNFASASYWGYDYDEKPDDDGAWIILNSWGDYYHEDGYFYASYESQDVLADGICAFDMQAPSDYSMNFQHDGNAAARNVTMEDGDKAAAVFNAPFNRQIRLDAVGMTVYNDAATDYEIQVYTGLTSPNDPESGALACTTRVSTDSPGYKTVKLPKQVTVDYGESYSIVITFSGDQTLVGVEENYREYEASIQQGQSFFFEPAHPEKGWQDLMAYGMTFRINGLANDKSCSHNDQLVEVVDPTMYEDGYTLYRCSKCGHSYKTNLTLRLFPTPDPVEILKAKAGKKCFTARWLPQTQLLAGNNITGYQIRYSLKKNMAKAKMKTIYSYDIGQKKITKLKSNKKYYMQVRCFFDSPEDGVTYDSAWSDKQWVKTK